MYLGALQGSEGFDDECLNLRAVWIDARGPGVVTHSRMIGDHIKHRGMSEPIPFTGSPPNRFVGGLDARTTSQNSRQTLSFV